MRARLASRITLRMTQKGNLVMGGIPGFKKVRGYHPDFVEGARICRDEEQVSKAGHSYVYLEAYPCQKLWRTLAMFRHASDVQYSSASIPIPEHGQPATEREAVIVSLQGDHAALLRLESCLEANGLLVRPLEERHYQG